MAANGGTERAATCGRSTPPDTSAALRQTHRLARQLSEIPIGVAGFARTTLPIRARSTAAKKVSANFARIFPMLNNRSATVFPQGLDPPYRGR